MVRQRPHFTILYYFFLSFFSGGVRERMKDEGDTVE
jgi:hypothetical protein